MTERLKVVYICHFSNGMIRERLSFRERKRQDPLIHKDYAVWITNAIKQFEKYSDIDFHVVFPHRGIRGFSKQFTINGINYHCFRPEDDFLPSIIINKFFRWKKQHRLNRFWIRRYIREISPDIVHLIGAENPYYSLSLLDVPKSIPCLVSLQTLMSAPHFFENFAIDEFSYRYRTEVEKRVLIRADYIGCPIDYFKAQVEQFINENAVCLSIPLATGKDIDITPCEKQYDFVHFANDISKVSDWVIEAFAIAVRDFPGITLNICGYCPQSYKAVIDNRIEELGIRESVIFTGPKETNQEVIAQIKKSRFALLPLKVDMISTTVREAMACGLPTISTITEATPEINNDGPALLLAEKGDIGGLANHMKSLLSDNELSRTLSENALSYARIHFNNDLLMKKVHDAYFAIVHNYYDKAPIDNVFLL